MCGGTYSWDDFVATLNALGHNVRVVRIAPEVYDGFFPGAKETREMFQYFEAHTYFGPDAQTAITAANAQNSACAAPVDSRWMPKLSTITNASGDSMITYFRMPGPKRIDSATPLRANKSATMPVSSPPDAM